MSQPTIRYLAVDLTNSKLGPAWRSCRVEVDATGWTPERLRAAAADYYGVPPGQVREITRAEYHVDDGAVEHVPNGHRQGALL